VQSQLRELQLAEVQAAAVGKSDHYRSLRVRGDRGANEAQRAPQLEVKDQCPAAAELKQQGLPAAADPFDALPSQRIGKCLRAADGDRTSTDAMTLPRITRCRLRLADSTSGSSGIRIYTNYTSYATYTITYVD